MPSRTADTPLIGEPRRNWRDERGAALIIALLATILLTALGVGLVLLTSTETTITANYRDGHEALYAADAGVERVVQDLLMQNDWNQILSGGLQSGFFDGNTVVTLPNGTSLNLEAVRTNLQAETDTANTWGTNNPTWQWYGRGYASDLLPGDSLDNRSYIVAFVGDDPSETDGDPTRDVNGVVTIHVEAFATNGARKVLEVTVSRTASSEIERGYIAQRGQDELNQRARKAAVQTPERSLTNVEMNVTTGGFTH